MGIFQILIISIGLSLDVFAYCLYRGATISKINKVHLLQLVGIFVAFQVGMMLVGSLIAFIPAIQRAIKPLGRLWDLLAALIFFSLGVWMIAKSFRKKYKTIKEQCHDEMDYKMVLFWAFMTSIDSLIAGFGFGILSLEFWLLVPVAAIITAANVVLGIIFGYLLGCGPMNRFVAAGGCIVIVGGIDVLMHYFTM